ncbi:hypothetical protein FD47_GL000357 [Lentilactobacillus parafarraginis DSM 18390 = JCM 14109]|uniref:Uncharacterized protein n=1 Tax=Lentilactobacillus parafarraginis DSM 18390 = JCM 14109 TaxID=1423786 RepID=A0A0R1YYW8_9LACO|nr:hypothetical protein FD47_GL000356 [Lentilactobacillus parafarraginis DSM 18390 = JCM 14109]KRM44554.1 hypothetical protein FD47_GL000357 [Lentilactobacillus parafarraginis DSM 18390 = JCM 14109]
MRGEYLRIVLIKMGLGGSPPHAWGILKDCVDKNGVGRITPTCVGNTAGKVAERQIIQDHPHMRGEYQR